MEWVFAFIATTLAVSYAVLLGRGIEKRQRWALEIARALGGLDTGTARRMVKESKEREAPVMSTDDEGEQSSSAVADRLAA